MNSIDGLGYLDFTSDSYPEGPGMKWRFRWFQRDFQEYQGVSEGSNNAPKGSRLNLNYFRRVSGDFRGYQESFRDFHVSTSEDSVYVD